MDGVGSKLDKYSEDAFRGGEFIFRLFPPCLYRGTGPHKGSKHDVVLLVEMAYSLRLTTHYEYDRTLVWPRTPQKFTGKFGVHSVMHR